MTSNCFFFSRSNYPRPLKFGLMLGSVLKLVMFYLYQSSRPSPSQEGQPLWLERWDIPSPCATFWVTQPHPQSIHQTSDIRHQCKHIHTHTDILYFLFYIFIYIYIYIYIIYIYIILYIHICIYLLSILWFAHPIPNPHPILHSQVPAAPGALPRSGGGPCQDLRLWEGRHRCLPHLPRGPHTGGRSAPMPWMPWKSR